MKNGMIQYGVCGYRSSGERVYYVNTPTQGENLIPYAASLARKFDTKAAAKKQLDYCKANWGGIVGWTVFQDI